MKILDLASNLEYIDQYIQLRNENINYLLTEKFQYEKTLEWLKKNDIKVFCLIVNKKLQGALIIHHYRNNELTIFTGQHGKGYGSVLMNYIDNYAVKNKIKYLYAWTKYDNSKAIKLFNKFSWFEVKKCYKIYRQKKIIGILFKKDFFYD